jgi:hypothetical protein
MENSKFVIAFIVLVIGIFLMPIVGYAMGIVIIPLLILAAGYLLYIMIKSMQ